MSSKAEKDALEILLDSSAYYRLREQLEEEQAHLLWQAMWEQQILTLWQAINHAKPYTCQAWRDKMNAWLGSVVKDYKRLFEPKGDL